MAAAKTATTMTTTTTTLSSSSSSSASSLLLVLLDCQLASWRPPRRPSTDFATAVDQLCVFLNAYVALNHSNRAVVLGAMGSANRYLHPRPPDIDRNASSLASSRDTEAQVIIPRTSAYLPFKDMNAEIYSAIQDWLSVPEHTTPSPSPLSSSSSASSSSTTTTTTTTPSLSDGTLHLAPALARLLCYANRAQKSDVMPNPSQILVVSASPDAPESYVALMNAIFSAQKMRVPVDVCRLYSDSVFLQQAAHLTGGTYHRLDSPAGLFVNFINIFLPAPSLRRAVLRTTEAANVDFRAVCSCHRRIVDAGFVCSVCLTIYCQWSDQCAVCSVRFDAVR